MAMKGLQVHMSDPSMFQESIFQDFPRGWRMQSREGYMVVETRLQTKSRSSDHGQRILLQILDSSIEKRNV